MAKSKPQNLNFYPSTVCPVVQGDFFPAAVQLIDNAEKSIDICVFAAKYYRWQSKNPINDFFHALRRAAQRGVKVRLLLNADFGSPQSAEHNTFIVQYFKHSNLQAALGGKSTRIHSKLILIDNQITVIGSHNYSARAGKSNFETSVLITGQEVCRFFLTHYDRLWQSRTLVPGVIS